MDENWITEEFGYIEMKTPIIWEICYNGSSWRMIPSSDDDEAQ